MAVKPKASALAIKPEASAEGAGVKGKSNLDMFFALASLVLASAVVSS